MNKIGIHYGSFVSNWMEDEYPLISRVSNFGFDAFEMGVGYLLGLDSNQRKKFRDKAEEENILLLASLGLPPSHDIGSPDLSIRQRGIDYLIETANAMVEVGAPACSGIIHGAWNGKLDKYEDKKIYWKNSIASMKEISKVLEDLNVQFNVEVVNRFENFLINTCTEALAYVNEVNSPNLGIHLDTFHINIEEDSIVEAITRAKDKLKYFHIGENNRKFPGTGTLPWKIIFDSLKAINYQGVIGMEPFVKPGGEVGKAISLFRDLMDLNKFDQELEKSLSFVKGFLSD